MHPAAAREASSTGRQPLVPTTAVLCHRVLPALQRQAQALVTAFGMDPALPAVLRELWLSFLAHSRLLEPATIR